jgi:small subunit ribosomal protein S18
MADNITLNNEHSAAKESVDYNLLTYKDTKILSNFISDQGKVLPRRVTGLSSKQQKKITKLIKTARIAALLPFVVGKG